MAVIDECVTAIKEYTSRSLKPSLTEFLEETSLTGRDDSFGEDDPLKKSGIRLMTLHSAKGLEFPRVYLVGLEEGLLPHQRAVDEGTLSGIEEERRLTYVGITRARDFLTITSAATRTKWGKRRESVPSRFLKEMLTPIEDEDGETAPDGPVHS
jgi:DNA helicase-2/ATP-dependent DNA helicase PcrA